MKKITISLLLVLILFIMVGCDRYETREVGLLDMDRVLAQSQRAKELQGQLAKIGNELEKRYNEKEEELSGDEEEEELDKIYQEYLDNKARLEEELNKEIRKVIAKIYEEKDLEVVIDDEEVFFGGVDITEEVIQGLDRSGEEENVE